MLQCTVTLGEAILALLLVVLIVTQWMIHMKDVRRATGRELEKISRDATRNYAKLVARQTNYDNKVANALRPVCKNRHFVVRQVDHLDASGYDIWLFDSREVRLASVSVSIMAAADGAVRYRLGSREERYPMSDGTIATLVQEV